MAATSDAGAGPGSITHAGAARSLRQQRVRNDAPTSLGSDIVFRDGAALETPTVAGDVTAGLVLALTLAVDAG